MEEEHFGIAVAELQRAGCIPFVHNSGGPPEIIGDDPRLTFQDPQEAAQKIAAVLASCELQGALRTWVERRRELFSAERFSKELRAVAADFVRQARPAR